MRLRRTVATVLATVLVVGVSATASVADEPVPSQSDVDRARDEADRVRRDVAGVRAELAVATSQVEAAQVEAAVAAEAYNGALVQLEEARAAAADARRAAKRSAGDVRRQQEAYGEALARSYQSAPAVAGLAAMAAARGVAELVQQQATMGNAVDAMEGRYDSFRATATVAELSSGRADDARDEAERLETEARTLRDAAVAAAAHAAERADELEQSRDELIAELAEAEGISVAMARTRQEALEEAARTEAEDARRKEAEQGDPDASPVEPTARPTAAPTPRPSATPRPSSTATPTPGIRIRSTPPPAPEPEQAPAPRVTGDVAAVIAFAEAQLGEKYVWGAAGPDSWDCSGLTMKAWAKGGTSLPHWSVGQYQATTPITAAQLQPGDLVFFSNDDSPSSIFHVALYVGDGMIIHAPRTGRPVTKESLYYWRTPDFFGRP